ncbi:hypothetical protein WJX73_005044 [Symbiochloris irregularis]|uniref:Aquaporin n=1 Tax=Symbiochloris irregularis TaxID=706552 RepID=A0AAW1P1I2_9CHLO
MKMWKFAEPTLRSRNGVIGFVRALVAEFLGTLIFVLFTTGTITSGCHSSDVANQSGNGGDASLTNAAPGSCFIGSTTALLNIALAFGFTLFVVIYFTASVSGGHINPAVSIAFFLAQKISFLRALCYVIFQCAGAACGSVIVKGLDPTGYKAALGGSNALNATAGITWSSAFGFEMAFTTVFVLVVFAATDSRRLSLAAPLPILAPLAIGMMLFVCHLVLIPIDGCSVNPARSFGPAMVSRSFNNYWIFWAGPVIGGVLAPIIYEIAFRAWEEKGPTHGAGKSEHDVEQLKAGKGDDVEAGMPMAR